MVEGLDRVAARLRAIPDHVLAEVTAQLEKEATKLVLLMESLKPIPVIEIGWTWGDAPRGSVTLGQVSGRESARIAITVFATSKTADYPRGFPAIARWFEHGTLDRFWKSGKYSGRITAHPYFYPAYRADRTRIKSGLRRAITRALKKA